MRTLALTALAVLLIAGCAPTAQPTAPTAESLASACAATGGTIQPVGKAQIPTCVRPYADASKACTDKSQCQGACILEGSIEPQGAVTGQCQKNDHQFGCYAKVENGKATAAICVD